MEEHGKVICVMQVRSGISPRTSQPWYSQSFVIEIDGRYTRRVKLSIWGQDRINRASLEAGQYITCRFEIEAHEVNGDFYNDLRCYDIIRNGMSLFRDQQIQQAPQQTMQQAAIVQPQPTMQQAAPIPYRQENEQMVYNPMQPGYYQQQPYQHAQQNMQKEPPF